MPHFASNFLIQKSKILTAWIVGVHFLAIFALFCAVFPWMIYLILLMVLVFSFWIHWKKYILLTHPNSINMLSYLENNHWELECSRQKHLVAQLIPSKSHITSYWLIVTFLLNDNKTTYALVFFSDSFATMEMYKQVRRIVFENKLSLSKK